jgi:WD40 repeat protein
MKSLIISFLTTVIILLAVLTACVQSGKNSSENTPLNSASPSLIPTEKPAARYVAPTITPVDLITPEVLAADLIVFGIITDLKYDVQNIGNGRNVWTVYTLAVDKVLKGDPQTKVVSLRLQGGKFPDGTESQVVNGYRFEISNQLLLALDDAANGYSIRAIFYQDSPKSHPSISSASVVARVQRVMQENNLPVSLAPGDVPAITPPSLPRGEILGLNKGGVLHVLNSKGRLDTYDLSSFKLLKQNELGGGIHVASSPDGQHVFAASSDNMSITIINIQTGDIEGQIKLNDKPGDIGFLGVGELFVAFPMAKTVEILNPSSFVSLKTYEAQYSPVCVAFSPDGKYLYETFNDETYNADMSKPANTFAAIEIATNRMVTRSKLTPGSHTLLVPRTGNHFYINHRTSGLSMVDSKDFFLNLLSHPTRPFDRDNVISGMAVTPNNDHLYVGTNSYVRDLDPATGELVRQLDVPASGDLYLSPSGKFLVSTNGGGLYIDTPGPPPSARITFIDLVSWQIVFTMVVENGAVTVLGSPGL